MMYQSSNLVTPETPPASISKVETIETTTQSTAVQMLPQILPTGPPAHILNTDMSMGDIVRMMYQASNLAAPRNQPASIPNTDTVKTTTKSTLLAGPPAHIPNDYGIVTTTKPSASLQTPSPAELISEFFLIPGKVDLSISKSDPVVKQSVSKETGKDTGIIKFSQNNSAATPTGNSIDAGAGNTSETPEAEPFVQGSEPTNPEPEPITYPEKGPSAEPEPKASDEEFLPKKAKGVEVSFSQDREPDKSDSEPNTYAEESLSKDVDVNILDFPRDIVAGEPEEQTLKRLLLWDPLETTYTPSEETTTQDSIPSENEEKMIKQSNNNSKSILPCPTVVYQKPERPRSRHFSIKCHDSNGKILEIVAPNVEYSHSVQKRSPSDDSETSVNQNRIISYQSYQRSERQPRTIGDLQDGFRVARKKRKIQSDKGGRWTLPIRYRVDKGLNAALIQKGLKRWESLTCVTFKRTTLPVSKLKGNYLNFVKGDGCHSMVGKNKKKKGQSVSLGAGCEKVGIVSHEVGHALGLWHEHARPDRDESVSIVGNNVPKKYLSQFLVQDFKTKGIPYDYGSIMHYASKAYVKSQKLFSIEKTSYRNTMGQRDILSFLDAKVVNQAYCKDKCKGGNKCKNGGYPNPKSCSKCMCPDGMGGKCDAPAKTKSNCGTIELKAGSGWKTLKQSGNKDCNYLITASNSITIEVSKMDFKCAKVCTTFVEVKYLKLMGPTGARFCCNRGKQKLTTKGKQALIIYKGDGGHAMELRYKA